MSPRIQLILLFPLVLLVSACGEYPTDADFQDYEEVSAEGIYVPSDVDCDPNNVNGFYETLTIRRSGLCPDIDPFVLKMRDGEMRWGENCTTESVSFSEQSCQQDTRVVCQGEESEIIIDARLAQLEEQGSILTGIMTIQFKNGSEESSVACVSEYQTKLERF